MKGKDAEKIADILRDNLDHFSSEQPFDKEVFAIFEEAMRDKDPYIRGSAVTGCIYLGWPELAKPLRALAKEPDESIRKDAALLAGRLEKLPKQPRKGARNPKQ